MVELTSREQGKSSTKIAGWEGKLSVPRRVTSLGTIVGPMLSMMHFCEFIVDHRRWNCSYGDGVEEMKESIILSFISYHVAA